MDNDQYTIEQQMKDEQARRDREANARTEGGDVGESNEDRQRAAEQGTATQPPGQNLTQQPLDADQRRAVADRAKRKAKKLMERNKRLSKMKEEFSVLFAGLGPRFSIDELLDSAGRNAVEVLFNKTVDDDDDVDPPASVKALELSAMGDEPVVNAHQRLTGSHSPQSVIPPAVLTDEEAREQSERIKQLQGERRERDTQGPINPDYDPITGVPPPPIPGAEGRALNEPVTVTKGVGQA